MGDFKNYLLCRKRFPLCRIISLFVILINSGPLKAGENEQVIRGRCLNSSTQQPIKEAVITVYGTNSYQTKTDSNGYYFIKVPTGKYTVSAERNGYKALFLENIVVNMGKQQIQDFELSEFTLELSEITIRKESEQDVELNSWNIQQFASVNYDPGRVINSHAGVVNNDEQSNNVTVRGTTPNYFQWRIEGIEVVNPNHLENAGTINDRPTLNGGGVSLISAQLLHNSGLHFAPFSPEYGNALSGIFDIRIRRGNDTKMERTIQASLLGTDIALEGPFSKNSRASYLVNLRYSTVGLLSKIGVNFGDEKINFKDISFSINYPLKKGAVKLFGISGNSENIFRGKTDSTEVKFYKDQLNIDYFSFTSIAGLNYITSLSNTVFFRTVLAYSIKKTTRNSGPNSTEWAQYPIEKDVVKQQKVSGVSFLSKRLSNHNTLKAGMYYNYFISEVHSVYNDSTVFNGTIYEPLIQPFVSFEGGFGKWDYEAGFHTMYQHRIRHFSVQPRFMLRYNINSDQSIAFNYGIASQLQPFLLYLGVQENKSLEPTSSHSFSLLHTLAFRTNTLKTQLYYQLYNNIPVSAPNNFSAFNYFNEQINFRLENSGTARVYGIDMIFEKHFNSFYLIPSISLYSSTYSVVQNTFRKARFNTGYNGVITAGKEFKLKSGQKYLSTDIRVLSRDGYREAELAENPYDYNIQLPKYFRIDFRISYRKNKERSTTIWALDIQNVTNSKNVSYHYYDRYTRKVETKYQLGLIPILSYKILF
ncbi:MAG: TonB-dependent receptor [Bacteroidia bacterium]